MKSKKKYIFSFLLQSRGITPKSLVSDNGLEFKNDLMDEFCNEHGIKQVFGQTYNPKSNALAESTNNIIRKVMRAVFLKYGDTNWISHLDEILNSINSSKAYSTGKVRSEIFYDNKYIDAIHEKNLKQKRQLQYDDELNSFKVGDKVRISLNSIETEIRKRNKMNLSKYVIAKFSYDIYEVVKIVKSKNKFTKDRYKVKDSDGQILSKQFYGNELQLVPNDTIYNKNINKSKIDKINRTPIVDYSIRVNEEPITKRTRNDNYYEGKYYEESDDEDVEVPKKKIAKGSYYYEGSYK